MCVREREIQRVGREQHPRLHVPKKLVKRYGEQERGVGDQCVCVGWVVSM